MRSPLLKLAPWLLASLLALPALAADDFEGALSGARRALKKGDAAGTIGGLRRAMAAAWQRLPFTVVEARLVAAPPSGFGHYLPRVDNVYRLGEPLILYVEPVGFTVRRKGKDGPFYYRLAADFNLVDAWGRVVSGRRNFGRFGGQSNHFPLQVMLSFTYSLSGLAPGSYQVETVLRDMLGKESYTIVTPIEVQGP